MKKLGHMNWILALIVLEVIATFLNIFSIAAIKSIATTYYSLVCLTMGYLVIFRLFLNWLWFTLTSRRYYESLAWNILSAFRIIAICIVDYREISSLIYQINAYGAMYNINPTILVILHFFLNFGMLVLFHRRNEKETQKALQEQAAKEKQMAAKELEEKLQADQKTRDLLCDGQRPESDDYGYSIKNPICTSTISSSYEYISRLRTLDGESFDWIRQGSTRLAICNNVRNVIVDTYTLYLHGKEFKEIHICPYGHNSSYAPKGLMLVTEKGSEFGGNIVREANERNMSIESLLIIKRMEAENELLKKKALEEKSLKNASSAEQNKLSTELERVRTIYGAETDELIKYWSAFYYLDEQVRKLGNNSIFEQMRVGLLESLKNDKGQSMVAKVMQFCAKIDEDSLAKELDILSAIENDETGKFRWF